MKRTLKALSDYYKVPAKRGVRVRIGSKEGIITAHSRVAPYVNVRWNGEKYSVGVHPFDLDYLIDGEWQIGQEMCDRFNARIDAWNGELNRASAHES